jgi:hypothetical protein
LGSAFTTRSKTFAALRQYRNGCGRKLGMMPGRKLCREGFKRIWPPPISMDEAVKAKAESFSVVSNERQPIHGSNAPSSNQGRVLIDTDKYPAGSDRLNALLDAIADWNNTRWGGRTNHVAFVSGGALSDGEWRQIEITDPDCLLAFAPLSDSLLLELDERVNPWSIEIDDHTESESDRISVRMDGIGMPPTVENLRRIRARYPLNFGREEKLLMFEFAEDCDQMSDDSSIATLAHITSGLSQRTGRYVGLRGSNNYFANFDAHVRCRRSGFSGGGSDGDFWSHACTGFTTCTSIYSTLSTRFALS